MKTLAEAVAEYQRNADLHAASPRPPHTAVGDGDPHCGICGGLGYIRFDLPVGAPQFGRVYLCQCRAREAHERAARQLEAQSGLEAQDEALSWNRLIAMPGLVVAIAAVQRYLLRGWGWVYLWGDPGPGKTLMLKTAVAEFVRSERSAALITWADLLAHLRAGYTDDTYDERLQLWRTVRLLAIDEMGRAKESEWVREVESRLLNYRYEQGVIYKRSLTLFASNLAETAYDEWLSSRLRDGRNHVVHVESPDLRPAMDDLFPDLPAL